jgi:hypothetical protein
MTCRGPDKQRKEGVPFRCWPCRRRQAGSHRRELQHHCTASTVGHNQRCRPHTGPPGSVICFNGAEHTVPSEPPIAPTYRNTSNQSTWAHSFHCP